MGLMAKQLLPLVRLFFLVGLISLGGMLGCLGICYTIDHFQQRPFDQAVWLAHPGDEWNNPREFMLDALFRRYDFHGMTRAQILDLLGPTNSGNDSQVDLDYVIGDDHIADAIVLSFEFDKEGKVVRYRQRCT